MTALRPPAPSAPGATASLVLGLCSVAGSILLLPVLLGPLAWYLGASAQREAQRDPVRWSGAGTARTGMVLGMVATALLLAVLLALAAAVAGLAFVYRYDAGYGT
ncbi:DUF4190 domain-containing protein [Aeromicrobium chenweiae]|uniref:Uncharacterized protein n=1 Tax=Aeromicrobium chenweiae TaxID=2079793 RepID=A0A2S0WQC1_9ACTN|nr:DUF4190 domain-containing protein [Aeromicrobium chenweiae]AWB93434.1 hypothetical protein C3E78_15105 [Aeromicrobium chenweiae]TGN34426.1 DUF4190 domain-containing protein [Aeromicrobium chenweiae]